MRAARFLLVFVLLPRLVVAQGNPLGPEFRVNTYGPNDQAEPSVAADSSGNFVVIWQREYGAFDTHISGQRYATSGVPLGAEFRVNASTFGTCAAPSVAGDPAGNFVVIWQFAPLEPGGVLGQRYASSGVPLGGNFLVGNSAYNFNPAVASDSSGNFVVVWEDLFPNPTAGNVFGQRFANSGPPLGSVFRVNTYTTGHQAVASVAVDPSGNFVVVWNSGAQDGSGYGVYGQRFARSGAPVGTEFRVNTYTPNDQSSPSAAADSSGNFVVVWQSALQDGSGHGVFGQRYAGSGAPLGPEFRVNTFTTSDQRRPSVAADGAGNFVVLWQSLSQDGAGLGVFGQRYASSGIPLGPEFLVNTYTSLAQAAPSVASDSFGNFVVAWQSLNQDGSGYGVFGQRYQPILPVELMRFGVE